VAGAPVVDLSRYIFEVLHHDEEFILYRGRSKDDGSQVLVLSPAVRRPTPESLKSNGSSTNILLKKSWIPRGLPDRLQLLGTGTVRYLFWRIQAVCLG
jgi:hypothetical protein